jgi:hypothetical protein
MCEARGALGIRFYLLTYESLAILQCHYLCPAVATLLHTLSRLAVHTCTPTSATISVLLLRWTWTDGPLAVLRPVTT